MNNMILLPEKTIVRFVEVDRTRTPEQAIVATCRRRYVIATVVASMPNGSGGRIKITFFQPDESAYDDEGRMDDDRLEWEFASYRFKPADPYSLAAANEADPAFADEYPNATHWREMDGKWRRITFSKWDDGRRVGVYHNTSGWPRGWWFAGLDVTLPGLVGQHQMYLS